MMIMKKLTLILLSLALFLPAPSTIAQEMPEKLKLKEVKTEKKIRAAREKVDEMIEDTLTNEYLDTISIRKKLELNDYSMIGFQYGASLSQVMWNPAQKQDMLLMPVNFGVMYTRYGKMFGYMPYFGFQAGLFYAREGYQFEYDEDDDYTFTIEGAEKAVMQVVELPVLAHIHVDFWKMKLLVNIGCYAGYRMSIERFPGKNSSVAEEIKYSFLETDNRFDYGIKGGVGIGLVFDPIEIHITGMYKHSFSSLYQPDYYSEYYYRYAYPSNIIISAGVHFQLTKRTGQTKHNLKKIAKEMVYGK
jgi:hypothetical protein